MENSDDAGRRDNLDRRGDAMIDGASAKHAGWRRPVGFAVLTTAVVAALSYALPDDYAASAVGLAFLLATYLLTLHTREPQGPGDADAARHFGLSLGGLFDPEPIDVRRVLRSALRETAFALAIAAIVFPPFWAAWLFWWHPRAIFHAAPVTTVLSDAAGQFLVIALPEEAFYRGYLQTSLDSAWPPRWSLLGARLGPALIATSAIFAVGHVITDAHPSRLSVFFPSLLFGLIRTRRQSVGTSALFHALCNLFSAWLARSYGFF